MHPVHIGIGSDDHPVVTQVVERIFNIQRVLEQVEFLVLVNYFLGQAVAVQRFTPQAEHRLGFSIP